MTPRPNKPHAGTIETQIVALASRVAALERQSRGHPKGRAALSGASGCDLGLIEQLRRRQGRRYRGPGLHGAVAYAGAVAFGDREYLWIREHPLPELAELEAAGRLSQVLATLGHSARLLLVRTLFKQPRTRQELQAVLGVAAPGPLYHHLKALLAAGIVTQSRRGLYEIAARHVVPVLAVLAAAADLADTRSDAIEVEGASRTKE